MATTRATNDIYDLHDKAFEHVSAYVILKGGERVATIALKFPADGAGRLWAYVQWFGIEMVRGYAGGFGYDKRSAAIASAVRKVEHHAGTNTDMDAFFSAIDTDGGEYWDTRLRNAGFTVLQAV